MTLAVYVGAAISEIAGCFAFWAWLRLHKSPWWLGPGRRWLPIATVFAPTKTDCLPPSSTSCWLGGSASNRPLTLPGSNWTKYSSSWALGRTAGLIVRPRPRWLTSCLRRSRTGFQFGLVGRATICSEPQASRAAPEAATSGSPSPKSAVRHQLGIFRAGL